MCGIRPYAFIETILKVIDDGMKLRNRGFKISLCVTMRVVNFRRPRLFFYSFWCSGFDCRGIGLRLKEHPLVVSSNPIVQ